MKPLSCLVVLVGTDADHGTGYPIKPGNCFLTDKIRVFLIGSRFFNRAPELTVKGVEVLLFSNLGVVGHHLPGRPGVIRILGGVISKFGRKRTAWLHGQQQSKLLRRRTLQESPHSSPP